MRTSALLVLALVAGAGRADMSLRAAALAPASGVGVLVLAHGGEPDWDRAVRDAAKPVGERFPTEIAFGMSEPAAIQEAVGRLEKRGARRIVAVALQASAESFKARNRKILGLDAGAPPRPPDDADHGHEHHAAKPGGHAHHDPDTMPLWRVDSQAQFFLVDQGLMDADAMGEVLAARALGLSKDPKRETVLILAHGPGDDAENARWLERLDRLAEPVRKARPFSSVHVETLREDWPEKRRAAEARVRTLVVEATAKDGRCLVIPFRVHGFGPYAAALKGLSYVSDGRGLLPHPRVGKWLIEQTESAIAQAGWGRATPQTKD